MSNKPLKNKQLVNTVSRRLYRDKSIVVEHISNSFILKYILMVLIFNYTARGID